MTTSPFGRVLTAMVTPMSPGGEVDEKGTDALVDHLLDAGHDGIVVNGTTGEASTLTDDESIEMVTRVKERAAGRATVVAGVGTNDTRHAVDLAGGPRGPAPMRSCSCPPTTTSPRRPAWSRTSGRSPTPPTCR